MIKKIKLLLILIFAAGSVCAQDAQLLLGNIQSGFEETETLIADFNQTAGSSLDDLSFNLQGTFFYKKGNNFKISMKKQEIISDGVIIWNFDKRLKRVVISPFENELTAFSLDMFIFEYPSSCKISCATDSSTGYRGIVLKSNKEENEFTEIKLFVDENFVLKKIEIKDFNETKYFISLFNVRLNVKLDDGIFNFTPPEGIKIVDLR